MSFGRIDVERMIVMSVGDLGVRMAENRPRNPSVFRIMPDERRDVDVPEPVWWDRLAEGFLSPAAEYVMQRAFGELRAIP